MPEPLKDEVVGELIEAAKRAQNELEDLLDSLNRDFSGNRKHSLGEKMLRAALAKVEGDQEDEKPNKGD